MYTMSEAKQSNEKRPLSGAESEYERPQKQKKDEQKNSESQDERCISLDMSKYGPNIQKMTDEELVQIFDIGVAVKESFTLTVAENSSFVKEELKKQMQPIQKEIKKLPFTVREEMIEINNSLSGSLLATKTEMANNAMELKKDLVDKVSEVAKKVLPVNEMEKRIKEELGQKIEACQKDVQNLTQELQKPAKKGSVGEKRVISILSQNLPRYTFQDVSKEKGKGDIQVETPDGRHFLIEVKDYKSNVPKDEIKKFKGDVMSSPHIKVGIMMSLSAGIAMKCKSEKFEINHEDDKYLIYVPNALLQQEVMIWSVPLANELAGLDVELNEDKTKKLQELCQRFQEQIKYVKICREKMETLQKAVQDLKESVEPIFLIIESANKTMKAILSNRPSPKRRHGHPGVAAPGSVKDVSGAIPQSSLVDEQGSSDED